MFRVRAMLAYAVAILVCTAASPAQEKKIQMIPVKYDGLKQEILKQRGKVVLVDFWAGY